LLDGKPEARANAFRQITISPDGKQIAMIVTPQQNAPSAASPEPVSLAPCQLSRPRSRCRRGGARLIEVNIQSRV